MLMKGVLFMLAEANMKKLENAGMLDEKIMSRRVGSVNKENKVIIRVTDEEKEKLQAISAHKGITMSKLIMDLLTVAYL